MHFCHKLFIDIKMFNKKIFFDLFSRWQSPRLSVVVMTGSVYLSIRYPGK